MPICGGCLVEGEKKFDEEAYTGMLRCRAEEQYLQYRAGRRSETEMYKTAISWCRVLGRRRGMMEQQGLSGEGQFSPSKGCKVSLPVTTTLFDGERCESQANSWYTRAMKDAAPGQCVALSNRHHHLLFLAQRAHLQVQASYL